jgi:prophage DNA circulation protein
MSGAFGGISNILSALQSLVGSRSRLLPASFRGVPFYAVASGGSGGRRLVTHEFPLRDDPFTEDLGKLPRRFKLHAYVIDDPAGFSVYQDLRDALIKACEANGAAVLMHPTFGPVSVRAGVLGWSERIVEAFGYCDFQLEFVVDGPQPGPAVSTNPLAGLLAGLAKVLPYIVAAYGAVTMIMASPAAFLSAFGGELLGLPPQTLLGLAAAVESVFATPGDQGGTALAVQNVTQAMADNVIAAAPSAAADTDAVTGVAFTIAAPADVSGGLATLATWGNTFPPIAATTPLAVARAVTRTAVVALVQGSAVAALIRVYASIDWPYAAAAAAARDQVVALIQAQIDAAADAGADDLYRAWCGILAATVENMIANAQGLPQLGNYSTGDTWPSLPLALALFGDASRAGSLEDINDVPHPLFMPVNGLAVFQANAAAAVTL